MPFDLQPGLGVQVKQLFIISPKTADGLARTFRTTKVGAESIGVTRQAASQFDHHQDKGHFFRAGGAVFLHMLDQGLPGFVAQAAERWDHTQGKENFGIGVADQGVFCAE